MQTALSAGTEHYLDASGLLCPEPVMLLHKKIRSMHAGECVQVLSTDPASLRDIPKFCTFLGHELIRQTCRDNVLSFVIRKGARDQAG